VRIVGDEYRKRISQDARTVRKRDWIVLYNGRDHRFSSSSLRKEVADKEK
jgi:glycerol-3-phosphate cytidylyltransferase